MDFKLIYKKAHGTLTPEEEHRFQKWYKSSPGNRAYFERVRRQQQEDRFVEPDVARAWKKIEKEIAPKPLVNYRWLAAAAAIVIGVLLFPRLFNSTELPLKAPVVDLKEGALSGDAIVFIDNQGASKVINEGDRFSGSYFVADEKGLSISSIGAEESGRTTEMNSLIVPRKKQYKLQLSDGTNVWLNSQTKLHFPTNFDHAQSRTVLLEYGEAYFEVTPAEAAGGKNFIVETEGQRTEVLGTQFNLKSYPEEEYIATTLVEGIVQVRGNGRTAQLNPGGQSLLEKGAEGFQVREVDPSTVISWREGTYIFKEQSLGDVMRVLQRWYDVEVDFEGEVAKKELLTGVLRNDQELEVIIQILQSTNKAVFEFNENTIKVKDKKDGNGA